MKSERSFRKWAVLTVGMVVFLWVGIGNAIAEEKICIDVTQEHSAGLFEKKGSDTHLCQGKKITHIEFQMKKKGAANAQIEEQTLPDVTIQWRVGAFSHVTYTLKVWVAE